MNQRNGNHRHGVLCLWLTAFLLADLSAADEVDFNRDIRPILTETCYQCHGPDANKREADLRLDTREGLFGKRDAGVIVRPGRAAESLIVARLTSQDPEVRMPPPDSGRSLSDAQRDLIHKWIEQGADWAGHWAYQPIKPPEHPPGLSDGAAIVDWFIDRGIKQQGLLPVAEADQRTLARRLYFDLTGLPPTYEDVRSFQGSPQPQAYAALVDRLLASPRFGERMTMYWLDLVRYADTNGIHGDNHRDVSLYRDYVIQAFNENRPFDQFTIEQIAGDLLPQANNRQRVASGYNRLLMTTREGGAQAKEYRAKYAADRVRNVSSVWLGSTVGCAECHDHKYDPFATRDFYSLAAFFADITETAVGQQPATPIPTAEQARTLERLQGEIDALMTVLNTDTPQLQAEQKRWEADMLTQLSQASNRWQIVRPEQVTSSGGAEMQILDDLSVASRGKHPEKDTYTVTLKAPTASVTGIRLEALTDPTHGRKSLSRGNGNFVLNRFELEFVGADAEATPVKLATAVADFSQKGFPIAAAIDGKSNTGWAVDGHRKAENRVAMFVLDRPLSVPAEARLIVRLRHESHTHHNIGRFRLALTSREQPRLDGRLLPQAIAAILKTEVGKRKPEQARKLAAHYRSVASSLNGARADLAARQKTVKDTEAAMPKTLISIAGARREMRVLPRGNWLDDSGPVVQPAIPATLGRLQSEGQGPASRLDLARWLVANDNPLTARVFVNRLWWLTFKRGLVSTLDDFGSQGGQPSHPELLDWLAVEFQRSGWNVKHMVKLLVMTKAYRRSSQSTPATRQSDPYNRWLARQTRLRLDAEMIRDNALAVSGLLVHRLGGPSVKPYQPSGYWAHLNFPKRTYKHDQGPSQYRRGLYTYWCRTFLHPSMRAFDAPTREECTVERPQSNNPLQALVLLNDPTYVEAARVLAQQALLAAKPDGDGFERGISELYRRVLLRQPTSKEVELLRGVFQRHVAHYQQHPKLADAVLHVGLSPVADGLAPAELAAWTSLARVMLNLHETITRS